MAAPNGAPAAEAIRPAWVRAARLGDLEAEGRLTVDVEGHTIALFLVDGRAYAVDNRCPHMGFPLDRGSVKDCILTCHWHDARFDLATGGTFDQFAGDVQAYPAEIRDGDVWLDLAPRTDPEEYHRQRLRDGLERNIPLVLAKAAILLLDRGLSPVEPFAAALAFGVRYRAAGWGQGLTILTCMQNLLPHLAAEDRPRALYHGLSAVAQDCDGEPARFPIRPLPGDPADLGMLKRWFRQFIRVRDGEGAERCVASAVRAGAGPRELADMLFAAVTDHRYIDVGHPLDFTNKAFEALDAAGWGAAEAVLASLPAGYARARRMEESNAWRHPIDLVAILEDAFDRLGEALEAGRRRREAGAAGGPAEGGCRPLRDGRDALAGVVLGENPRAIAEALLDALREGCSMEQLAAAVTYAAALRIARFHTANEFPDWDTALHTFTFANAVHQGLLRAPSPELLRGVFDAAMSVYLDRFLNVPPARLPEPGGPPVDPDALLAEWLALLDRQQQVNPAGELAARYLFGGGDPDRLVAALGRALLREDRNFHTIQAVEAAVRQHGGLRGTPAGTHVLVAAARYLAAHAPTMRAQGQTYQNAVRLHRGERLFEEA